MPVNLEIVSPEKLLLSRDVDMVVIPAAEGDMGVLEGHAPMMVALRGGIMSLYEGDRITDSLFVVGGFAEVTPERCTVLAGEAMPVNEIERSDAEKRCRDAEEALSQVDDSNPVEEELALERVHSARAMLEAVDGLLTGH
jgi:F-type H+-transporting ATPase subunit epsilon